LLVVEEFVAIPKEMRKGKRRRSAGRHQQQRLTDAYLLVSKRTVTILMQMTMRLDGVMRRVDDPGTMNLGGETEKHKTKRARLAARHTTHKRTADENTLY